MCAGAFCMVALDVAVRTLLERYPLTQVVQLRSLFAFIFIGLLIMRRRQPSILRTRKPGWHLLRSVLMTGSMLTFFFALKFLPLADVIVLAYAAPLIVTALSRPLLGEPVGLWRWLAVIIGFVGVLIVVRPGSGVIEPAALYALAGATFYAMLSLTARKLSTTESTWSLSLYSFVVPTLLTTILSASVWLVPDWIDWLWFVMSGVFGALAFLFVNAAYGRAPAAIVVPFEYTGLIWATGAGYLFWAEIPGLNTWLGAAIIIASGLLILFRETVARPKPAAELDFPLQEAVGGEAEKRQR